MRRFLGLAVFLFVAACGGQRESSHLQKQLPIDSIQVHSGVPQDQRDRLAHAVDYLKNNSEGINPNNLEVLGLEENESLLQWLELRVHYIVPFEFDINANLYAVQSFFAYENASLFPQIENPTGEISPPGVAVPSSNEEQGERVMSNLSPAIYDAGKLRKILLGVHVAGANDVIVTTPRTGILQIGENLIPKASIRDTASVDIYLLSILFHEARHSDGNGTSTGFSHARCPEGHSYPGAPACDRNTNGPYSVEAAVVSELARTCKTCSKKNLEFLKDLGRDSADRILNNSTPWDPSPEGRL